MYKLIRDNIPTLAKEAGKPVKYAAVDDPEFVLELLLAKLKEELGEFNEALNSKDTKHTIEELADVMTVVGALAGVIDSKDALNEAYATKLTTNGGFEKHYILLDDTKE